MGVVGCDSGRGGIVYQYYGARARCKEAVGFFGEAEGRGA